MQNRTDLALELKEEKNIGSAESGIIVKTRIDTANHIKETKIIIKNKKGEISLGKPKGSYITIEAKNLSSNDGSFHKEMSEALFLNLKEMLGKRKKILIAGLGNANVTADSLGPKVVNNLCITRHLEREGIGEYQYELSAIAPGVMAQTGMETGEIVEGIVKKIHPDALVVIDALAAKSSERLNRTIQISNTGIAPGSGVGNHRNEITEKTMGIPVIAIGVPTVISIPSLACDIMEAFCASQGEGMEDIFCSWPEKEKYHFLGEILDEKLWELFVTPKEIDEAVKRISYTLSEGINQFVVGRIF